MNILKNAQERLQKLNRSQSRKHLQQLREVNQIQMKWNRDLRNQQLTRHQPNFSRSQLMQKNPLDGGLSTAQKMHRDFQDRAKQAQNRLNNGSRHIQEYIRIKNSHMSPKPSPNRFR